MAKPGREVKIPFWGVGSRRKTSQSDSFSVRWFATTIPV